MYGNVATALSRAGDADIFSYNGPANATEETVKIGKVCQLLILRTGLALDDLEPQVKLANTLVDSYGVEARLIVLPFAKQAADN